MDPLASPPDLVLRSATAADIPAVQRLAERTWRAHYPAILSAAQIDYMLARGYARPALERFIDGPASGIELADSGATLAGFAAWLLVPEQQETKLDKLYVDPDRQRSGIGGALIRVVEQRARDLGARGVILNVNRYNTSAQAAYARAGFTVRDAVVVDIGEGFVMDDYVMARPL